MGKPLQVGIIGDYRPGSPYHVATNAALHHAAAAMGSVIEVTWVSTPALSDGWAEAALQPYDALWAAPGSPYASMEGALAGIRFAREQGKPFVGT